MMAARMRLGQASTHRAIRWLLGLQIGLGLMMIGGDFLRAIPSLALPSAAPPASEPIAPGDQTRRYAPRELPDRRPGLPFTVPDAMPTRLTFEADGATLRLVGQIAEGDGARFADHLAALATPPERVALLSPGGSVADALAIGRAIRAADLPTVMEDGAVCLSACPYMLAGGSLRSVDRGARVGVHQHYFGENVILPAFVAVADIQRGLSEVVAYLDEMGVEPSMLQHGLETPPDEIYILLPDELEAYRLATELLPEPG